MVSGWNKLCRTLLALFLFSGFSSFAVAHELPCGDPSQKVFRSHLRGVLPEPVEAFEGRSETPVCIGDNAGDLRENPPELKQELLVRTEEGLFQWFHVLYDCYGVDDGQGAEICHIEGVEAVSKTFPWCLFSYCEQRVECFDSKPSILRN